MKIKVTTNGMPTGTQVTNAETGEIVEGVRDIFWTHRVGEPPRLVLTFVGHKVDFEWEGEWQTEEGIDVPFVSVVEED